jgi:hypothetical protein
MAEAKTVSTKDKNENPIQILKEATCPTSSGKSTLTYQVGKDKSGAIYLKVFGNDGGGFWSPEWVAYTSVAQSISDWPNDQGITSMAFRKVFRGKSANTPGFLVAVLCAEKILEPVGDKKRVHQACDPATFLASLEEPPQATGKKPATKAKTPAKAKSKAAPKTKAKSPATGNAKTAKTPRKSPAASRKGK